MCCLNLLSKLLLQMFCMKHSREFVRASSLTSDELGDVPPFVLVPCQETERKAIRVKQLADSEGELLKDPIR